MIRLRLYGTPGCHLCDEAAALVDEYRRAGGRDLQVEKIDIAGTPELEDRYGIRIPVLADPVSGAELGWPFDGVALRRFVDAAAKGTAP